MLLEDVEVFEIVAEIDGVVAVDVVVEMGDDC